VHLRNSGEQCFKDAFNASAKMACMHKSLARSTNRMLITAWALGVVALLAIYGQAALPPMIVGGVAGVVVGALQARAIWLAPSAFAQTSTLIDVRRQLRSSLPGTASIVVLWLGAVAIVWIVWNLSRAHLSGTSAVGYLMLMFTRDLVSYPLLARVESARPAAG
jgi:hypothetical protein